MQGWQIENCVLYVCVAAMTLGLYAMGAGLHCLWSLALLGWANYPKDGK
jgi:hypothetical protein